MRAKKVNWAKLSLLLMWSHHALTIYILHPSNVQWDERKEDVAQDVARLTLMNLHIFAARWEMNWFRQGKDILVIAASRLCHHDKLDCNS